MDWNGSAPGETEAYDWYSYAQENDPRRLSALSEPEADGSSVALGEQTIGEWLRQMNDPARLAASHRTYFDIAMIGNEGLQPGANWVGYWYGRNLRIFRNLVHLADRPSDRVAVVFGAGHAYLLRQFAIESGAFRLVDVDEVLSER